MSVDDIIQAINELSVLELVELKDKLQEQWGVSAAAPVAVAAAPGVGAEAAVAEEQTEFDAILTDVGENKIHVIKAVREVTNLGLKEAKELVESAPGAVIAEAVSREDAEAVKAKIEEAGGKVDIK